MTCKNICGRLVPGGGRIQNPYQQGLRYCRRCEVYLKYEKSHCPCCLLPNELVYTSNGVAAISEIKEGDYVLDHHGKYTKVMRTFEHDYEGYLYKIKVNGHKPVAVTEEHPIFIYDNEVGVPQKLVHICRAEHIKKGDFLVFVKPQHGAAKEYWLIGQKRKGFAEEPDGYNKTLLKYVHITPELCRLWGYYLAEGSCKDREVTFYFDRDEMKYIDDIKSILNDKFALMHIRITQDKRSRTKSITVSSAELTRALVRDFGTSAEGKRLPSWIYSLPKLHQQQLLIGYFNGDGGVTYRNGIARWYEIKTISMKLAYDIRLLASQFGMLPSINYVKAYKNHKEHYAIRFWAGNASLFDLSREMRHKFVHKLRNIDYDEFIGSPVIDITKEYYKGKVYNIETESHTYMTSAFLSHNCGLHLRFTPVDPLAKEKLRLFLKGE